ncbi:hypothetical protein WMY93_011604 [Mugilogobius chulae]|uniref:MHC class I antigen n=1 Tax=Mugilogobius chulae TaxID=88201 RepID=A0AAW0P962_9GOBI
MLQGQQRRYGSGERVMALYADSDCAWVCEVPQLTSKAAANGSTRQNLINDWRDSRQRTFLAGIGCLKRHGCCSSWGGPGLGLVGHTSPHRIPSSRQGCSGTQRADT